MSSKEVYRPVAAGTCGAVATGHPLATQAAASILHEGGNAFDAGLTASFVLAVVEPFSNGLGGDALVLLRTNEKGITSVLGIGTAPQGSDASVFSGHARIPRLGPRVLTVPGMVAAWDAVFPDYCTLPLDRLLAPAIAYAADGFPVARQLHSRILNDQKLLAESPTAAPLFLPGGEPRKLYSLMRQPDLASTLRHLVEHGLRSFYEGPIANALVEYLRGHGGFLSHDDLGNFTADIAVGLGTSYRSLEIWETPPPSQGFFLLEMLKILEPYELSEFEPNSPEYISLLARAMLAAFEDRDLHLGDPAFVDFPAEWLLSSTHCEELRRRWGVGSTEPVDRLAPWIKTSGDTINAVVVDRDGNAISFIQSNYNAFGSMIIPPSTGVLLNNRLSNFSLDPDSPNYLGGEKRPAHTLNAAIVEAGERPYLVYGCPSGDVQIQANLQILANIFWFGMDPQRAVAAPRWYVRSPDPFARTPPNIVTLEKPIPRSVGVQLSQMGFHVRYTHALDPECGGSQAIQVKDNGGMPILLAGADPRRDGYAAAW